VGLVVGFQLMQAGCELVAVVDVADQVGGYGVHASKLTRAGVPLFTRHTILRALGENGVEGAVITAVGDDFRPIPNSEREIPVDTICVAVGLSPMSQLASMAGCDMLDDPAKSGLVPLLSETLETSVPGIFAAGDVSGIEEASSAMIEGRIAGLAAANRMGFLGDGAFRKAAAEQEAALSALRKGMFAPGNKGKKFERTDEGAPLSESLLARGFVGDDEIARYTAVKAEKAIRPVIECTQNIPCNPCQDVCPAGCIRVRGEITALPALEENMACTGCGLCVASCSGQAIFLVKLAEDGEAEITLPYEFLPLPREGDKGVALGRDGRPICNARVTRVKTSGAFDRTHLLTIRVPAEAAETARFFRKEGQVA
jgi:Fe-S-cluster-containing hydrogenase component 2